MPISDKVAERLGLAADATDDDVLAKIAELEQGKDDSGAPGEKPADPPAAPVAEPGAVEKVAAQAAALGLTVVPPEKLEQMSTDAAMGKAAYEEMTRRRHAATLDTAISKGKIAPAQRPHFESLLKLDEHGTTKVLAEIPDETAAPMTEVGHSLDPVAMAGGDVSNDPLYAGWKF